MKHEVLYNRLHKLFFLDEDKGCFIGKAKYVKGRKSSRYQKEIYGSASNNYKVIKIDGTIHRVHRLMWLFKHKIMPNIIDHKDRNPSNNKMLNLKNVTQQQNARNCNMSKNNKSGVTGVIWYKNYEKWRAYIMINRKQKTLGYFSNFDDAVEARVEANKKNNFDKKHGVML